MFGKMFKQENGDLGSLTRFIQLRRIELADIQALVVWASNNLIVRKGRP